MDPNKAGAPAPEEKAPVAAATPAQEPPKLSEEETKMEALRKHAGLPPRAPNGKFLPVKDADKAVEAKPAEDPAKPAETKPPEAKRPTETEGELALRLVREQRQRQKAEAELKKLQEQAGGLEKETVGIKSARELWTAGKFVDAIRQAFGTRALPEGLLTDIASADAGEPQHLSPEELREQIRKELQAEQETARKAQEEKQRQESEHIGKLRAAAASEIAETLKAAPEKWPTVWHLGVTGEQIADEMDALIKAEGTADPVKLFDKLEREYRGTVEGLPWIPKAPPPAQEQAPAPRTFGGQSMRGPTPIVDPDKPKTAKERWAERERADKEWRQKFLTKTQ